MDEKRALEEELRLFKSGGTTIAKQPSRTSDLDKDIIKKLDDCFSLENEP